MPRSAPKHRPGSVKAGKHNPASHIRTLPLNQAAWRKLRAMVLAEQPECPDCAAEGRVGVAWEVDHADGNMNNNNRANLIGRCKSHHSRKTATQDGGFGR